jgi:hypothetical protein
MPSVERNIASQPPTGAYALRSAKQDRQKTPGAADAVKAEELASKDAAKFLRQRSGQAFARRNLGDGVSARGAENQDAAKGTPAWKDRALAKKSVVAAADSGSSAKPASAPQVAQMKSALEKKTMEPGQNGVQYFHQYVPAVQSDTLLWHPTLWLVGGQGNVPFDLASGNATYRVLLLGHSPTGRFGFYETRLDVLGR